MSDGWARFHRKIADWEWYTDPNTFRVFFHLVLMANHKDNRWKGIEVKRGQYITSIDTLKIGLKLSNSKIRTSLDKLKSTNEITIKTTNRFTVITIENYDLYQSECEMVSNEIASDSTNKSQTNRKQIATNKNEKNVKKEKKEDIAFIRSQHLSMTEIEYNKLVEAYGKIIVDEKIEYSRNYLKLKNYVSLYKTLNNWLKSEKEVKPQSENKDGRIIGSMPTRREDFF